jgi:hypothetical protein
VRITCDGGSGVPFFRQFHSGRAPVIATTARLEALIQPPAAADEDDAVRPHVARIGGNVE